MRVQSNQRDLVVNRGFLYKYMASILYKYKWVRIRGRHETQGSDEVPGWILCVGTLVRLNECLLMYMFSPCYLLFEN